MMIEYTVKCTVYFTAIGCLFAPVCSATCLFAPLCSPTYLFADMYVRNAYLIAINMHYIILFM